MDNITAKFGGSSLADAAQFRKVEAIVRADSRRKYIVVSAPGRRNAEDTKVTDLLYQAHSAAGTEAFPAIMQQIRCRFEAIAAELAIEEDFGLEEVTRTMEAGADMDYCASRGEYLNARLMALYLGRPFLDAADCIFFRTDGSFDAERTYASLENALKELPGAVLPGFYGAMPDGSIHTFTRGGSDITGAIVAHAAGSCCYENWTDVSGILTADPRIIPQAVPIRQITYRELRELTYTGASVLHEDAIFPVRSAGIPIHIRNTNAPNDHGTVIVRGSSDGAAAPVTGIAGMRDFSIIHIEKAQMNETTGFIYRAIAPFAAHGINIEHLPTGIDSASVVVHTAQMQACRAALIREIQTAVNPDTILVEDGIAIISVVGHGMIHHQGVAARVFMALANAAINVRLIDLGSDELNIILGVDNADYEAAIRTLYAAFFTS